MFELKTLVLWVSFALCLPAGIAHATVYNVTNTADGTGLDQLRGALVDAGNTPGTHTVNVIAGTYYIDPLAIEIGTASGVDITINAAGPGNTIIDARNLGRGFVINPNADQTNVKVAFNGMTFQNCISGTALGGGAVLARNGRGNAISFDNCWFFNNKATNDKERPDGGAIFCFDVSLSVTNCTFTGNTAYVGNGGAIGVRLNMASNRINSGQINIANSLFSHNKATNAHIGAISIIAIGGPGTFSTSITGCTFIANSADQGLIGAIGWTSWINGSKLNINYNRFLSNTARDRGAVEIVLLQQAGPPGSPITFPTSDLLNAKNNWWGCNAGAVGCNGDDYGTSPNGFAEVFTPHLQLKTTLNTQSICYPGTNSVQASTGFTSNSANELIDPSNLGALIGRPVSISASPGGMGIISGVSKIQANGMATANFISNGTPGVVEFSSNSDNSSNKAPLTINTPGSWLGTTSNDWYLPANWCGGAIPTASTNVNIPAGTPNSPVIKISQSEALAKNLTIAPNASLSLDANSTLDVKGDFTNNGSFNAGADGAYTLFSGTGTQTIPGGTYSILGISGGNKTLTADATLSHYFVFLSNTKMILGNNTFTVASPSPFNDFNSERYFITNGTGGLKKKNLGASGFTFPIGSATSYMPVVLSNTGAPDHFTARVGEGVYTSYLNNVPQGSPVALKAVNSTWYISEDVPGGSNVGMSLYWNPTDELPSFDRSDCYVSHYQNGSWKPTTGGVASGGNPFFASRSGITSFSPFAVTNPDSPLPVTLARFDAVKEGSTALLSWSTTEETNSERFEVEHSLNGKIWQKIGTVRAKGESKVWADYHFTDEQPVASQENLYRLKIIDRGATGPGAFTYSRIKSLKFDSDDSPVVFPNPVNDKLFVHDYTHVSSLRIIDVNGKVVYQSGTMKTDAVNVEKLTAGVHLVEIGWLDGRKSVRKIVININQP
ncbi:Por secretion system C-terminal sorting domain-containing protein [Dyadobacter sp. SG02]|uniref:T9SS type A sorting domain-containing protein n=1 Tax=Dyadobacter sp. SG02 TaxID=1855291 RepID=UPI0008D6AA09|nr:T9SS type A sorting domain-containing protein [Dyadobacter sp. SG02]SEJ49712.1 Por secretion system C-terminal sorting domain-containing protein [Dyadobacter sp. SG02]